MPGITSGSGQSPGDRSRCRLAGLMTSLWSSIEQSCQPSRIGLESPGIGFHHQVTTENHSENFNSVSLAYWHCPVRRKNKSPGTGSVRVSNPNCQPQWPLSCNLLDLFFIIILQEARITLLLCSKFTWPPLQIPLWGQGNHQRKKDRNFPSSIWESLYRPN